MTLLRAKLLDEAVGREKDAAPRSDVLAHDEDAVVAAHLLAHGVPYCLYDRLEGYGRSPMNMS